MADKAYYVGLDCGTSVVKAAAFDAQGNEIAVSQASFDGCSPKPGWMEYNVEDLWDTALKALKGLIENRGLDPASIAAIGPTGAGNGAVLLNADNQPVRNGIFALDNRSGDLINKEAETDLPARIRAVNGQCRWTGNTFVILKWLNENEPESIQQAARILAIKDYVKYRLTGAYVGDASEQSKLGLMDIREGRCTKALLALAGLEALADRMPPIKPSTDVIGTLTPEAAAATGLPPDTPVVNGLADVDACALGSGVTQAGLMSIVAGTWSINQLFAHEIHIDERLFGHSHYAVPGVYEHLEASPSSTANLNWFVKHACGDLEQEAKAKSVSVYKLIDEIVASREPASTEVFFHPYLYGSNTKVNARAGFYGLAGWQTKADLLAALFEGVVFSHNNHVEKLRWIDQPVSEIRLSGGAARSAVWSQMFCDVMGLPVAVPEVQEVGALGAAMCAMVGAGACPDIPKAADKTIRISATYTPNMELNARYAERYAGYKDITESMGPVWDKLTAVFTGKGA